MKDVFFGPEETKLHGVLLSADRAGAPAAVICHPHPQHGGSMNNNVVIGVEAALSDADFTTLRFNFRGVGRSRGAFSGGAGEQTDVSLAVDFLAADSAVGKIFVAGYSFGAAVGLKAAMDSDRAAAAVGIAPPTIMCDFGFLAGTKKPLLLIAGSQDEFCDTDTLRSLVEKINAAAGGGGAPLARLEIIPGSDHFFLGYESRLGELTRDFLKDF
jgi:uncharacterized protein